MRLSPAERDAALELLAGRWPRAEFERGPERFWEWVSFLRMEGMAIAASRAADGQSADGPIPGDVRDRALRMGLHSTLHLEVAGTAITALEQAGMPALMFKGTDLVASGVYADPAERRMDDADLLVPIEAASAAVDVLVDAGFRPWSTWAPGSEGWLDTASMYAPGSTEALPLHLDLHWRLGRGELHFGAGGREEALFEGAQDGHPGADGHFVHVVEHLLRHLRVRPHPPGIADILRYADRVQDADRVGHLLLEGPLAPAALGLVQACVGRASSEAGASRLAEVSQAMRQKRPGLRAHGPTDLADLLSGQLSGRRGRLSGSLLRWGQTGGGFRGVADLSAALRPSPEWLGERYPEASQSGARLRYLAGVVHWLAGGPSPASPNQSKSPQVGR